MQAPSPPIRVILRFACSRPINTVAPKPNRGMQPLDERNLLQALEKLSLESPTDNGGLLLYNSDSDSPIHHFRPSTPDIFRPLTPQSLKQSLDNLMVNPIQAGGSLDSDSDKSEMEAAFLEQDLSSD